VRGARPSVVDVQRRDRRISAEPAIVVVALAALLIAFHLITEPIAVYGGLGYDGILYARMVEVLRSGSAIDVASPYVFRILPAAIVAWSGLDVVLGFYVLNVAATLAAGLVLLAFLRHCGIGAPLRGYAVVWWALLPFSLRFAVHDPVLVDGIGFLFAIALLYAVMTRRLLIFAVLLVAAVLTRDNLIVLAPLPLLRSFHWSGRARAVLVAVPAMAVLLAVHLWPIIAPDRTTPSSAEFVGYDTYLIVTNSDDQATRLLLSPLLALGILFSLAAARPIAVARAFAREAGWTFYAVATLLCATLGGLDHDRYLLLIVPLLLVAVFRAYPPAWRTEWLIGLTIGQLVCTRALVPMAGDASTHFALMVQSAPIAQLLDTSAVAGSVVVLAALLLRVNLRSMATLASSRSDRSDVAA
jgi:hypothetical protein